MKFRFGDISNLNGERKDLIVKSKLPIEVKWLVIGGTLAICGIATIAWGSFKHGAECYESAEFKTLKSLGLIKN